MLANRAARILCRRLASYVDKHRLELQQVTPILEPSAPASRANTSSISALVHGLHAE